MLKQDSKFQDFMLRSFNAILNFTSHFSLGLVHCFSSPIQAVTSQAENCEHFKGVLVELMSI